MIYRAPSLPTGATTTIASSASPFPLNRIPSAPFFHTNRRFVTFKTNICQAWKSSGHCNYGERCRYAHGIHELRQPTRQFIYKNATIRCNRYEQFGVCPDGNQCQFIHDNRMKKMINQQPINNVVVADSLERDFLNGSMASHFEEDDDVPSFTQTVKIEKEIHGLPRHFTLYSHSTRFSNKNHFCH